MHRILFVCHGNICRSPMAEFYMEDLVRKAGRGEEFFIASAAVSREEIGNPVYPPVKKLLINRGIRCDRKRARQITPSDYDAFDLLIGMDGANLRRMKHFWNGDPEGKCHLLLSFTKTPGDVADPYYSGDFLRTEQEIEAGCRALLAALS